MPTVMLAIYRKGIDTPETMKVDYVEGMEFRDAVMNIHESVTPIRITALCDGIGTVTLTVKPQDVSMILLGEKSI